MNNKLIEKLTSESLVDKNLHYKIFKPTEKKSDFLSFNQILMNI